jgi:hypothetical protein
MEIRLGSDDKPNLSEMNGLDAFYFVPERSKVSHGGKLFRQFNSIYRTYTIFQTKAIETSLSRLPNSVNRSTRLDVKLL